MATSAQYTFIQAVAAAEGVRQTAKASAFTTYAFVPANLAAYKTALAAADRTGSPRAPIEPISHLPEL